MNIMKETNFKKPAVILIRSLEEIVVLLRVGVGGWVFEVKRRKWKHHI